MPARMLLGRRLSAACRPAVKRDQRQAVLGDFFEELQRASQASQLPLLDFRHADIEANLYELDGLAGALTADKIHLILALRVAVVNDLLFPPQQFKIHQILKQPFRRSSGPTSKWTAIRPYLCRTSFWAGARAPRLVRKRLDGKEEIGLLHIRQIVFDRMDASQGIRFGHVLVGQLGGAVVRGIKRDILQGLDMSHPMTLRDILGEDLVVKIMQAGAVYPRCRATQGTRRK